MAGKAPDKIESEHEHGRSTSPGKSRRSGRRRAIVVALALTGPLIAALFCVRAARGAASTDQERSQEIVAEAETMIIAGGKSDPMDTAKISAAIDRLHEALKLYPRNDAAYIDLGFCYGLLREPTTAIDMYRTATLINPSAANYKELADIYLRAGNPEAALMAANAGLLKRPRDAKLYNAKGMALNDLTRFDEAAAAFRQALVYDPSFAVAQRNLEALAPGHAGTNPTQPATKP